MKSKSFLYLFIISILGILVLEDSYFIMFKSLIGNQITLSELLSRSFNNFLFPFYFVSLPFLFAYFWGWKKGFGWSIIASLMGVVYFFHLAVNSGSEGSGWLFLYSIFFSCLSVLYFFISWAVVLYLNKKSQSL